MGHTAKPKHQHWVPQFYLRRFSNDKASPNAEPQIWASDITMEPVMTRSPTVQSVCGKRYMYTPMADDTARDWTLDNLLGRLETQAAKVWSDIVDGGLGKLDNDALGDVATFVAALYLRNLYLLNLTTNTMKLRDQLYGRPEGIKSQKWNLGQPDPSDPGRTFANSVVSALDRITSIIASKNWHIVASKDGAFLTSDRPVVLSQGRPTRPDIASLDTMVALPLSPNRMLVMRGKKANQRYSETQLDVSLIACLNRLQALYCSRFVLSHVEPDALPTVQSLAGIKKYRNEMQNS